MFRQQHAATTVGTTMELAAHAGISFFATGGIGGVHKGYGVDFDISADLSALSRFPVAVVTSGVKSILDVRATREALETLGIPVVGVGVDTFPAFYLRDGGCTVDARFDDMKELAAFCRYELQRTGRGIVVANPIPIPDELDLAAFERWVAAAEAEADASGAVGRDRTPAILGALHRISRGATLRANIALVRDNTRVASLLAAA
jgi:pseudouridine-5'-phosphate glycosidase